MIQQRKMNAGMAGVEPISGVAGGVDFSTRALAEQADDRAAGQTHFADEEINGGGLAVVLVVFGACTFPLIVGIALVSGLGFLQALLYGLVLAAPVSLTLLATTLAFPAVAGRRDAEEPAPPHAGNRG